MPDLILRRHVVVAAYPDEFLVFLKMADGYALQVGGISKETGANLTQFWQWACPGAKGRSDTREGAMEALKAAWNVTDEDLARRRRQQEWTEWKYALWDAGYANKMGKGPLKCRCGEMFETRDHEALRVHIEHIRAPR